MMWPNGMRIVFKTISAAVAGIFLWQQIAWAGDIAVNTLDNLNDSQAQTFAPNYLQKQETLHKDIIDQKQAIEEFGANKAPLTTSGSIKPPEIETLDLKGPRGGSSGKAVVSTASYIQPSENGLGGSSAIPDPSAILSVTTQAGDVVHYIGSVIDYIERLDGSILRSLRFGVDGNLLDAEITHQDGRVFMVVNGLISSMEYPDHSVVTYTYIGIPGNITETIVSGDGKTAHYNASGRLTRVEFDNGRVAVYDSGILLSVRDIDDHEYIYRTTEVQDGGITEYMTSLQTIIDSSNIVYSIENNNITSIGLNGFTLSNFNLDSSGNVINGTVTYADRSSAVIVNGRVRKTISDIGAATYYVYSGESVQQAINSAASGDTIYLHVGTYHEHLVLSSGINLVGEDSTTTIIHGDYQTNSHVIRALGNNRIENITISGSGPYSGAPSSAVRIEGSNIKIRNNRITDNRDYALFIWSGDNILIEKNFFKDNGLGVQLPNSGTTIQYNTFVNNNISINVLNGPATVIRNNIITGSTFQSIYEFSWGAYSSGQPASGYAIVEGNVLYSNREQGGYYCRCLPPAVINQTLGNLISNPLFVNPAAGNYSIPVNSPAYNKGAYLPQALGDSLDATAGPRLKPTINTVSDTGITGPIPMPGDMFNASGHFNAAYDFSGVPYFDVLNYNSNRKIKNIVTPDGSIIPYSDITANQMLREFFSAGCMDDLPEYSTINSAAIADWKYYTEYYENGTSVHKKWTKDLNSEVFGDEAYCEYDTQGRLISKRLDDGTSYSFEYLNDTAILQSSEAFASNGDWQYSMEYYENGSTIHYKWSADANPGIAGNEIYSEYDTQGRVVQQVLDDGSGIDIEYLDSTTIISRRVFYDKDRFWRYSIAYRDNGFAVDKKWSVDPNPDTFGDVVYYEYDAQGREILRKMDDESSIVISYRGTSAGILRKMFYDGFGTWIKTIEYWDDGETRRYEWVADSHPSVSGDIVCREYDIDGVMIKKTLDTGSVINYTSIAYYTNWQYQSSSLRVGSDVSGEVATFKYINGSYLINSVVWEGMMISWSYNSSGVLQGYTKTLTDSTVKIYDSNGRVIEQDIPDGSFIKGVNLPWINYGYDMNGGFSSNPATLYTQFEKWKGSCVRIFLFCDLRSGINFDASGNPLSFKTSTYNDMSALLAAAKAFNIKLIPVLFDYMIADGKSGTYLGEHPDLITSAAKRQTLLTLFSGFFDTFADDPSIYAWDIMNEPEYASAVSISDAQVFVSDFVNLIHSKSPEALVTVGSARRDWLVQYWTNVGLDIYQYHYYDKHESITPINSPASGLGLDKPVIAGELEPTSVTSKLTNLETGGYAGGLFWQDTAYIISDTSYNAIRSYFSGSKATYSYYASGRVKNETWTDGTIREFEDVAIYASGMGRLIKETFIDASYVAYQYFDDPVVSKKVINFSASGTRIMEKDYNATGALVSIMAYYDNGQIRKITNSDGTYRIFDQLGNIIEQAIMTGGVISIFDGQNKLLDKVLAEETIIEYSLDGNPLRMLRPDGRSSEYYYNSEGALLYRYEYSPNGSFTIFDGWGSEVYTYIYNIADMESQTSAGESAMSVTTTLGDIIKYENGKILSIERKADGSIITNIELDSSGNLKNAHIRHSDGLLDIIYNNSVVETISTGGAIAHYRDNRKAFDYSNITGYTRYSYTEDVDHNINSITTVNKNATCVYNSNGLPVKFYKSDGSITEYENGYLKRIVDPIGREYLYSITAGDSPSSVLITSANGNDSIPSNVLYSSDGLKNIISVTLPDGTTLDSTGGILRGIYGLDDSVVIADGVFSFDDGEYKKYYNANGSLDRITTGDNTSIHFDGDQISEIDTESGSRVLYTGGRITDLYDHEEGAHYESNSEGRVTKVTYDNGSVFNYYYETLSGSTLKVSIVREDDPANVTMRFYNADGLLIEQNLSSGIISGYTYEATGNKRILTIVQTKNGVTVGSYTYAYLSNETTVTDMIGNKRVYSVSGDIKFMYTPEGYIYEYHMTDQNTLVSEMTEWVKGNGVTVYYKDGDVDRVETIGSDGKKTVLKNAVFDSTGKLKSFTVILPTGESRRCTVYDNGWSEINTSDAKLIYKDDPITGNGHLVAVNSNHRLFMFDESFLVPSYISVDITDDPDALNHMTATAGALTEYERQRLLVQYGVIEHAIVDRTTVSGSTMWKIPTAAEAPYTQGLSSYSMQGDTIIASAAINGASAYTWQGETFLDLRYFAGWGSNGTVYDLNNKQLSFYVKLQDGMLPQGGKLTFQAFAKDSNWRSEYSTEITATQDGEWYKINLDISGQKPMFGLMDSGFDPFHIATVGVRVFSPSANFTYNGLIYIKDANHQSVPPGENVIDFPFFVNKDSIKPYVGAIPDDQPVGGNPNYISWTDIPQLFLPGSNSTNNGQLDMDRGTWRAQNYIYSTGVESVTRDDVNNQWALGLNLISGSTSKSDGEMYVDLRYDIPGYTWTGPIDLTGKTLTFKVKAPIGFLEASNSANNPMWAQVFVKDENYDFQYGRNVQITQEGQWITVTLTPQVGEIEEGNSVTSPNFDPTRIVNIGVKISCNKFGISAYNGQFYVQNATPLNILNQTAGVYLLDINALKNYAIAHSINLTYEENLGPQIRLAKQSLPTYFKDDSYNMVTEYYPDGSVKGVLKGNSRVEYYNTSGKLIKITDKNDETLVEYKYDLNGDLTEIDYSGTRDTIRKAMDDARIQAQQQADNTIKEIAEAKGYAVQYVHDTIQPALDTAYATLANLQAQWSSWNNKSFHWWEWSGKDEKKAVMHSLEAAMGQVNQAISTLLAEASAMYAQIDTNIGTAKANIQIQLDASLHAISTQEDTAITETLRQEVVGIIDAYYKEVLGRSASTNETNSWLTRAWAEGCLDPVNRKVFDVSLVKTELATNQQYIDETSANNAFINDVNAAVASYLRGFAQVVDKNSALSSYLGLSGTDINYSGSDFEAIIKWLSSNNKHFGKSAFAALTEILKNNGKTLSASDFEELAIKSILIDIFSGSITSITTGELEISMFALSKYASVKYGLTFYNTKLNSNTLDALKDAILGGKEAIVRTNGDHFIVVASIAADGTVSYMEVSRGKLGEAMTMNKSDFLASWDGYAITQRAPLQDSISKVLSSAEARLVRGSDIFLILGIISVIFAITSTVLSFIDNEICQMLSRVFAIVSLVAGVLSIALNFGNIIQSFATGLQNVGESLKNSTIWLGEMFKHGMEGFVAGMATILSKAVSGICLNMSYNKALTTFGLNSDLAGITSAFLSGGFTGVDSTFSLTGGFTSLTMEGVRYAGRELGLDSTITGIIGMAASTIVSAGLGGAVRPVYENGLQIRSDLLTGLDAISYTIGTTVLPNVASEFAYYGINQLGEMIGIDSIVSQLAGIGIRSTISAGLRGYDTNNIFQGIMGGLLQGVASIGLNYATAELGLNPLLANISFSAIASGINAGIQASTGGSQDVFGSFFDTYIDNALTFLGYGNINDPNYLWLEASYRSSILDFSDIARQKGIVEALNTYGVSFFNSTTVGAIAQSGMTIGKYFADKLNAGQGRTETKNGKTYIAVDAPAQPDGKVNTAFFEMVTNPDGSSFYTLVGKGEYYADHYFWGFGELGKDSYGNLGFWDDATLIDTFDSYKQMQKLHFGHQTYAELKDSQGNTLLVISPKETGGYNIYDNYKQYVDAVISNVMKGYDYTFTTGDLLTAYRESAINLSPEAKQTLRTFGITNVDDIGNLYYYFTCDSENRKYLTDISFGFSDNGQLIATSYPELEKYIIVSAIQDEFANNPLAQEDYNRLVEYLTEKYGEQFKIADTSQLKLMDEMQSRILSTYREGSELAFIQAKNYILGALNNNVNINGKFVVGEIGPIRVLQNGVIVETSSSEGGYYYGDDSYSILGKFSKSEEKYFNADISVNMDGSITGELEMKALHTFTKLTGDPNIVVDASMLKQYGQVRADSGFYFDTEVLNTSATSYYYIGKKAGIGGESYTGLTFSTKNSASQYIDHEALFIPSEDLREGSRQPQTDYEKYTMLLYDIQLEKIHSLTDVEKNLIYTKTLETAQQVLAGETYLSQADIVNIANGMSEGIIKVASGQVYALSGTMNLGTEDLLTYYESQKAKEALLAQIQNQGG